MSTTCAEIAGRFFGDPNHKLSRRRETRWGSKGSFSVNLDLDRWHDFESGEHGDAIDLVRRELQCGYREALEWLGTDSPMPDRQSSPRRAAPKTSADNQPMAMAIWNESKPSRDTLAHRYLSGRGLRLDDDRIANDVVRFHPACPFGSERRPAMIALLQRIADFEPVAIQRIALDDEGNRALDRDGQKLPKLTLGPAAAAAIMLTHPYSADAYFGICEGPETGLALVNAGERNVWAMTGCGAIETFPVVPRMGLVIFADNDEPGMRAAHIAAQRYTDAGLDAAIHVPPRTGADFADMFAEQAA